MAVAVAVAVGAGASSDKTGAASVGVKVAGKVEEPPTEKNGPVVPSVAPAEDEVIRFCVRCHSRSAFCLRSRLPAVGVGDGIGVVGVGVVVDCLGVLVLVFGFCGSVSCFVGVGGGVGVVGVDVVGVFAIVGGSDVVILGDGAGVGLGLLCHSW